MVTNAVPSATLGPALLCEAGRQHIAIPVRLAGQVVEYDVFPLPLSRPGVRGLALYDGHVLISLGLGQEQARQQQRSARGVLLSLPDIEGVYALEIDQLGTLGQMHRAPEGVTPGDAWWVPAFDAQLRPHLWFDASAFVQALLEPLPAGVGPRP